MKQSQITETSQEKGYQSIKTTDAYTSEGLQMGSFGFWSIPINKIRVIVGEVGRRKMVFGCLMKAINKISKGESIQFSMDNDGNIKSSVIAKSNGDVTINEGTDYAVAYNGLKKEFNELNDKFNTHIANYNLHTHPVPFAQAISVVAVPSSGVSTIQSTGSNADINTVKVDTVRLP